jgi:cobalt/nickel transport system permease protein
MQVSTFDRFIQQKSVIHQLDPRVKVVITILFIVSNVLLPDGAWAAFGLGWCLILWINLLANLPITYAFKRSFIALPFALVAITIVFTLPGEAIFSFPLGPWHLTASDAGLIRFGSIVTRSWLAVQMAILLTGTTQFPDLMHALRHLRVPRLLVAVISFMYRYLFVLAEEARRLLQAREARSARLAPGHGLNLQKEGGSIPWRAKVAGNMVGQLFLRSYERSDRVYNAMLARGYTGHFLTINRHKITPKDCLYGLLALLVIAGIQLVGRLG